MHPDALGPVDPDEAVELSLTLRPRRPLSEALESRRPLTREEFAASYGADPSDIERVDQFAHEHGLEVLEASQPRRTVRVAGRAADIAPLFGVSLVRQRLPDGSECRVPDGDVRVPDELSGAVQGVFGFDTRPIARPRL